MDGDRISSTHPPLPPTTEDDPFDRLRLLRSRRVGISTYSRLIAEHGSAKAALAALPEIARASGASGYTVCPPGVIEAEFAAARALGARLITEDDADYPTQFKEIADAPPLFWCLGDAAILSRPIVALVGARNASSLGLRMAKALAADLGTAGTVVVSGLARGIDTAAHHAALETGTIAVMAGGLDRIYPAQNTELAAQIAERGALISEQPMGVQPQARHFPARNRIVSALASAVVVVEAAAKSGSLITARTALDQGRDVLAVPGHPFDGRASGCNLLIRDGATLVRSARDVLDAIAPLFEAAPTRTQNPKQVQVDALPQAPERPASEIRALHQMILDRISPAPMAEDQLMRDLALPADAAAPILLELELAGEIDRDAGGLIRRHGSRRD